MEIEIKNAEYTQECIKEMSQTLTRDFLYLVRENLENIKNKFVGFGVFSIDDKELIDGKVDVRLCIKFIGFDDEKEIEQYKKQQYYVFCKKYMNEIGEMM